MAQAAGRQAYGAAWGRATQLHVQHDVLLFLVLLAPCAAQRTARDFDPRQVSPTRWHCLQQHVGESFDLRRCQIVELGEVSTAAASTLAASIVTTAATAAVNESLRIIDLDNSELLDDGMTVIAPALRQAETLRAFHAHNTRLGDNGARALAAQLYAHPSLRTLDVNGNFVGDDGAVR